MDKKITAILIDDEEGARTTLASLLSEYCPEVNLVAQCANVPDGVLAINKLNPDVVFLDVQMPEYNGFELFDFIKNVSFEVVFVTAYSQYTLNAFEVSAMDYIMKPVEIENLQRAVKKAIQKKNQYNINQRLELMKESISEQSVKRIALPLSDGLVFVDLCDILFFEADRTYTYVILKNGTKILVSKTMRVFEEILNNRPYFFRPHRSYLININHIRKYVRGESIIVMDNAVNIPISRERKGDFEDILKELRTL